jgi:hypothetical protein
LAAVLALAPLSCAGSSSTEPRAGQTDAPAAPKPKTEAELRKEREQGLLDVIASSNLVEMSIAQRARERALIFGELAQVRFEGGDLEGAVETIERAESEAVDARDPKTTTALDREQFLILRFAALDAAKAGKYDRSMALFDKLALLKRLSRPQRDQVGGDRLLVIEMRGDQSEKEKNRALASALARIVGPVKTAPASGATPGLAEWTAEDLRHAIGAQIGKDVADAHLPSANILTETGRFDQGTILRVVSANKRSVTDCYARSLKGDGSKPKKGKVEILVTVQPSGVVQGAAIDTQEFRGTELGKCIAEAVGRWRFPPFGGGESRQFLLPFVLQYLN